jgi:hypothetical protein
MQKNIFSDFWKNKGQKCGPEQLKCSEISQLKTILIGSYNDANLNII